MWITSYINLQNGMLFRHKIIMMDRKLIAYETI